MGQALKKDMVIISPVTSQSGYGAHARDLVTSFINLYKDEYNIILLPTPWGNTPRNAKLTQDIKDRLNPTGQLKKQPDIAIFITIPPEFQKVGLVNIGITAGIEATAPNPTWIEGLNRMDFNIVPSKFAKEIFEKAEFIKTHPQTKQPMGQLKMEVPMEVLFEGADTNIYKTLSETELKQNLLNLDMIKEEFCFLSVGHWLQGNLGQDRKNLGMTIKIFLETFKNMDNAPALILKTSMATFSNSDRTEITNRINMIKETIDSKKLPNIYLVHGQLTDEEMNYLYNHPKVKSFVSFTRGEGFGRPLLEFTMSGKPVIASGWSGHLDFLNPQYTVLLPGKLEPIDASAVNDFLVKEGQWFTVDYNVAAQSLMEVFRNYSKHANDSKKLKYENKTTFSLESMEKELGNICKKYLPQFPTEIKLSLPVKKIVLPKLKKVESKEQING